MGYIYTVEYCSTIKKNEIRLFAESCMDLEIIIVSEVSQKEKYYMISFISSIQSLSHVQLFATPWTAACQASLFFTISWSLLKSMSTESVMLSNNLILGHPVLLLPSIFPIIRVFYNESALQIRGSIYWRFSFSISPPSEYTYHDWNRICFGPIFIIPPKQQFWYLNTIYWIFLFPCLFEQEF